MKQLVQDLRSGEISLIQVARPNPGHNELLVATRLSLISSGTERMLLDFGRASWLGKALAQPDKVKAALEKIRTDGIVATFSAVKSKLDQPLPMGYCNVGTVLESRDAGFIAGARVASNGKHAELVTVSSTLACAVPEEVSDEQATFTVLGAIALESIRLAKPEIGETVAVLGLGVIGLLATKILLANGCKVVALDLNANRVAMAGGFGAIPLVVSEHVESTLSDIQRITGGAGIDAVIIAAATSSDEPIRLAARMSRKRGRIVLLGVTGLQLNRSDFYEKELTFQVSCSYGPGRYDSSYEIEGIDYPLPYVRWTARRNMEAFLDLLSRRRIAVDDLVSKRVEFEQAKEAYQLLTEQDSSLGIILQYGVAKQELDARIVHVSPSSRASGKVRVSAVGAGSYASAVLLPEFRNSGAELRTLVSAKGLTASVVARKLGFTTASTDAESLMLDPSNDAIVIATNHDTHAHFVVSAIAAGKHVFVEKPLAVSTSHLEMIASAIQKAGSIRPMVCVGFNRRFAPLALRMKDLLRRVSGPKAMTYTVNAGSVPDDHWTIDPARGGGRLVGEACHFIDVMRWLTGASIKRAEIVSAGMGGKHRESDTFAIGLEFEDGSVGTVNYFASGNRAVPKERLEVFCGGAVAQLINFRSLEIHGIPGEGGRKMWKQDKGQAGLVRAFVNAIARGAPEPVPLDEAMEVTRVSLDLQRQLNA
jgi:predicted dehydrogenase/threonine dehydrogenase-like Zn-dependent dehydrogenase